MLVERLEWRFGAAKTPAVVDRMLTRSNGTRYVLLQRRVSNQMPS